MDSSKSSYKIDEIQHFFGGIRFLQKEERNYDKEGQIKFSKVNNKNNDNKLMGLPKNNKSVSYLEGGGNIISG